MKAGISFRVRSQPIPKQSFKYGKGHGRTEERIKVWQEAVGYAAKNAIQDNPGFELLTGDVQVWLHFYLPNRRRKDLDNLSKAVLDGLNGIIFVDDNQAVRLHLSKTVRPDEIGVDVLVMPYETTD